jgi:hypothetical protein
LAAGDFNSDGYDDLAIGAPFDNDPANDAGAVSVLYGGPSGLTAESHEYWTQQVLGDDIEADQFGKALAVGDYNDDGFDDLVVGAPMEDLGTVGSPIADAGAIHVIYGSTVGLRSTGSLMLSRELEPVDGAAAAGDQFGFSVAAGDFNCDGADDVAIGVPRDFVSYEDAGAVNVIYGIPVLGLFPLDDQLWYQGYGLDGTRHALEEFGYAVTAIPALSTVFVDDFESGGTSHWSDEADGS